MSLWFAIVVACFYYKARGVLCVVTVISFISHMVVQLSLL
ncbi:hypothetical protein GYH30_040844 [Glycine max]|nr:hypothetical protein GYH30_040844 [Glycine max]